MSADAWQWLLKTRLDLADRLDALASDAWEAESLCADWRVRDVVGHVVWLAEATRSSATRDVVKTRKLPSAAIAQIGRDVGRRAPAELTQRLRAGAGGRFVVPTQPPVVAYADTVIHSLDILRAVGAPELDLGDRGGAIATAYRKLGPVFGLGRRPARVRFVATDGGWSVGPAGGPVAEGAANDVLLAMAGRPAGTARLRGAGVASLAAGGGR